MKRLGITAKLAIHSAWILIGLGLIVTAYSVFQLRELLYQQMIERVEAQTLNWIEANYSQIILLSDAPKPGQEASQDTPNPPPVEHLKERAQWIAYAIVLSGDGRLLAHADVPQGLEHAGPADNVPTVTSSVAHTKDALGHRYFEVTTTVPASGTGMSPLDAMFRLAAEAGKTYGEVRVGIDRERFESHLADFQRSNILLAVVLVSLAVAASFAFARRIVDPVTAIGRAANRIAGGDFSERVRRGAGLQDEIGDLVRNFNRMAERLEESRNEMNLLYAGLEEKVRERTLELEEANRKLEERDRLKSEFISTTSHELRTPLTSIKAHAEILLDSRHPDPERLRRGLQIINESTDRLTRLITDILDLRKIESGVLEWRMAPADLRDVVARAMALLGPHAAEKGLEMRVAACEPQPVRADADRIEEVITNLVGNAVKFCSRGDRIEVRLERTSTSGPQDLGQGDYIRVAVADTGPGMSPGECARVFEPYFQGDKGRFQGSGAGLGLTISREIVLHHKGEIWVESQEGAGATFYFTLPLSNVSRPGEVARLQQTEKRGI